MTIQNTYDENKKRYFRKNRKKILKHQREYYYLNHDKMLKRALEYRKKNRERLKVYARKWRLENPEKIKTEKKIWYEKNRKRLGHRRLELRFKVFQKSQFSCTYCGRKPPEIVLEIDHINPVNNGGEDKLENYTAVCRECNIGKKDFILSEFPIKATRE